jgi:protein-S-isoprenylcysteine O-methyltransferase Ste14
MDDEQTFRAILIGVFVVVFPIAAYHRLRSQATGERLDRRREGLFILLTLRPVGLAALLGLVAYMTDPKGMAWSSLGVFLILVAIRTLTEEEHLLARFGDDYRAYRLRTGRFLPRIGR